MAVIVCCAGEKALRRAGLGNVAQEGRLFVEPDWGRIELLSPEVAELRRNGLSTISPVLGLGVNF